MLKFIHTRVGAAALSVASNTTLVAIKLTVGLLIGSVSVLSEGIHSMVDLLASVIAFLSLRMATRPADEEHPFGHGKVENVSGTVEGVLIFLGAGLIVYEAVDKILAGSEVGNVDLGVGVMLVSVAVNVLVSRHLLRVAAATDSVALEADARHLTTDILTSAGVAAGLLVVRITDVHVLDPVLGMLVALIILRTAAVVTFHAFSGLVDRSLPEPELAEIRRSIQEHVGEVVGFHELRTRKAGSERHIDLHLVMPRDVSLEEAHGMADHLEEDILRKLPRSAVTIHMEPCDLASEGCNDSCPLNERQRRRCRQQS